MFHVGDTFLSDVWNARRRGIRVGYVPRAIDDLLLLIGAQLPESASKDTPYRMGASVALGLFANAWAERNEEDTHPCYFRVGPLVASLVTSLSDGLRQKGVGDVALHPDLAWLESVLKAFLKKAQTNGDARIRLGLDDLAEHSLDPQSFRDIETLATQGSDLSFGCVEHEA